MGGGAMQGEQNKGSHDVRSPYTPTVPFQTYGAHTPDGAALAMAHAAHTQQPASGQVAMQHQSVEGVPPPYFYGGAQPDGSHGDKTTSAPIGIPGAGRSRSDSIDMQTLGDLPGVGSWTGQGGLFGSFGSLTGSGGWAHDFGGRGSLDVDGAGRQSPMDSGMQMGTPGQQIQYGSWGQSGMWPGSSGFLPSGSPQWSSSQFGAMQTMSTDTFSTAPGATMGLGMPGAMGSSPHAGTFTGGMRMPTFPSLPGPIVV